ncbi:HlyD family secretion protein [Zobellella sp. An-6]|uniref:HlyD family secretion protein n=1 Tax=Zobellella sp. An-6 TaxID=3400218 RepID=UPI0040438225
MTPEQSFSRWVRVALGIFILAFGYFVLADNYAPMTPRAQVQRYVVPVAPRVAGQVSRVWVENNQPVAAGDLLFELDDSDYRLALERTELALGLAETERERQRAAVRAAGSLLEQQRLQAQELEREAARLGRLRRDGHLSVQQLEQAQNLAAQAQSGLASAEARLQEARQGARAAEVGLRQAENARAQARLALSRTRVRAELAGRIGNLQLKEGIFAQAGSPLLALVSEQAWVIADLREKSLRHVAAGTPVGIVFDALPGEVFRGHVESIDSGVREGQQAADGQLAQPVSSDRWVRDAQRLRIQIGLDAPLPALATGAKATVQLFPANNWLFRAMGRIQLWLASQLRYLY